MFDLRTTPRAPYIFMSFFNDGYCNINIAVLIGRKTCDAISNMLDIGVYKYVNINSAAIKTVHNKSASKFQSYNFKLKKSQDLILVTLVSMIDLLTWERRQHP